MPDDNTFIIINDKNRFWARNCWTTEYPNAKRYYDEDQAILICKTIATRAYVVMDYGYDNESDIFCNENPKAVNCY